MLTLTGLPDAATEIERLVAKDGANSLSKEVSYRQGRIYYGFYSLPDYKGLHRYLYPRRTVLRTSGSNSPEFSSLSFGISTLF